MRPGLPVVALVKRELLTKLRSRWIFYWLLAFAGIAIFTVLTAWPHRDLKLAMVSRISSQMVSGFLFVLFFGCAVFVPGVAGGAISLEKETRTYELLHLTLIRPSGLITGKLLNVAGMFLLFVIAVSPVVGCISFLAGVDPRQFLWSGLMLGTCTLSCATAGIMCSTLFRRTQAAIVASYLSMLALMGGLAVPATLLLEFGRISTLMETLLEAFIAIAVPIGLVLDYAAMDPWQLACGVAYQALCGAACFLITLGFLRRPPTRSLAVGKRLINEPQILRERRRRFPFYLVDPKAPKEPVPDKRNPMLIKELRWGFMSRTPMMIRGFCVVSILFVMVGIAIMESIKGSVSETLNHEGTFGLMVIQLLLMLSVTPSLLAGALSKESDRGNLDMLRMTLLTSRQIVLGKFLTGITVIAPFLLAGVPSVLLVWIVAQPDRYSLSLLITGYGTIGVSVLLSLSLGLLASLLTRRTGISIVLSYGLNCMMFVGILFVGAIACGVLNVDVTPLGLGTLSPVAAFIVNRPEFRGVDSHASLLTPYWCAVMAAYLLMSCAIVAGTVKGFAKYRMRDR